jgi:hypothetical protein
VCVRACHLAAVGRNPRGPVVNALRQANLEAGEIQLVEMQGTVSSPARGLKLSNNGDFDEDDTLSTPVLSPLAAFGTTNLARLCGIGQYTSQNISVECPADKLCPYSLETSRLGQRVRVQSSQLFAVHFDSRRVGRGGNFESLGWKTSAGIRRCEKPARWSRATWTQSC